MRAADRPGIANLGLFRTVGFGLPKCARQLAFWLEAGLDFTAFIFLPLLVLAPRGAAALAAVAGVCAGGLVLSGRGPLRRGLVAPAALFGALVAWGTFSAVWASAPWLSLNLAARLAGLLAAGLALAAAAGRVSAPARLAGFLLVGFLLAAAMAAFDFASRGVLTQPFSTRPYQAAWLNQAANGLAILLLPGAAALGARGRWVAALLFAVAGAATVFALDGLAPKVALGAGLLISALFYLAGARTTRVACPMAIMSILLIITAPLTFARLERLPLFPKFAESLKQSAEHRLLIWSFVGDRLDERPLLGWGLDASRAIPGGRQPIRHGETWLPLHPHNAPLQLWLELGVPGAVLSALLAAIVWRTLAAARPRAFAAAAGGSLTAASVACLGTYGIWQEWWLGTLFFSLFLVGVLARASSEAAGGVVHPD
jgi:exopolysaccharide production protein ExoQ